MEYSLLLTSQLGNYGQLGSTIVV